MNEDPDAQVALDDAHGGDECADPLPDALEVERTIAAWPDRPYDLRLPAGRTCTAPLPLVIVMHGGAGNKELIRDAICPLGDRASSGCLDAIADREGFALAYSNGTGRPIIKSSRTYNGGGCAPAPTEECPWTCVSGLACSDEVDDFKFFADLLDDAASVASIDPRRIFATGVSNGAAMSHALACRMDDRIAAIAPIAGGNQLSTAAACSPNRAVPVVAFHGTDDEGWKYLGGDAASPNIPGIMIAVADASPESTPLGRSTMREWAERNSCSPSPTTVPLADTTDDGTQVNKISYKDCSADVVLYEIVGGGHTWPGGHTPATHGTTSTDISANEEMIEFFLAHPMP